MVQIEVPATQRDPDIPHAGDRGQDAVHRKARLRTEEAAARSADGQANHLDQLIGAVPEQEPGVVRQPEIAPQPLLQGPRLTVGVAVELDRAQRLDKGPAQLGRPRVGVLHGVELDEAGGVLDVIGPQLAHRRAHPTVQPRFGRRARWAPIRIHGRARSGSASRHSAARAWAVSPSARARREAMPHSSRAVVSEHRITEERFWKS